MAEETLDMMLSSITTVWAQECVNKAKGILKRYNVNEGSSLASSLYSNITKVGNGIRIDFYASDYYIYVDEGVKGIGFNDLRGGEKVLKGRNVYNPGKYKPPDKVSTFGSRRNAITTGRFSYKSKFVSSKMAKSIQSWIATKPIPIRTDKFKSAKTHTIPTAENLSWAIAKHIKRTGIGKTMFWSDTFNEKAYQDLADRIAKKLGGEYTIQLRGL